jgi:uracil-DNA glycosylase family 4
VSLQQGFFDLSVEPEPTKKTTAKVGCEACRLFHKCNFPKMAPHGKGKLEVLLVGEAPGKTEDEKGIPFVGKSGKLLESTLRDIQIDMQEDCLITNACVCRPPSNTTPTDAQIGHCRSRLLGLIEEFQPHVVIPLGAAAVQAVIGHRLSGRLSGIRNTAFFGEMIPDQEAGYWICPTYHPAYLLRNEKDEVLYRLWKKHLSEAFYVAEEHIELPSWTTDSHITQDVNQAIEWLEKHFNGVVTFDFETTGIKPHRKGHEIICVSFADGNEAWAFPFFKDEHFQKAWKEAMRSPDAERIAHKIDFEHAWSRFKADAPPESFVWDTCLAAHCLDNKKPTNLKYLTYVKLGILGYDEPVSKFIEGVLSEEDGKSANHFNLIRSAPLQDLMKYCAMDSIFSWKLYGIQIEQLREEQKKGFQFFLAGAEAMASIQQEGFRIDVEELERQQTRLTKRMDKAEEKIKSSEEAKKWEAHEHTELNFNSNPQLNKLFYKILGYETPESGGKTDVEALKKIGSPFSETVLEWRKWKKIRDTYLSQYAREQTDGFVYPFFNLHTVDTFRSSSDRPNFQNVPKRDKTAKQIVRSIIRPRVGNRLIEYDYKALEVCISACYHKDPTMIRYIEDPTTDMHRDIAMELFFRDKEDFTKEERYLAKNGFVFPEFYGSNASQVAPNIWEDMNEATRKQLKSYGIGSLDAFIRHVEEIEERFWEEQFPVYDKWKRTTFKEYERNGYVDLFTGFRCYGPLRFTEVTNYPIQGSAFHCLLWTIIKTYQRIKDISGRSAIIGQIHDAIVVDAYPDDEESIDEMIRDWGTKKIRKAWPWIIVPLTIEKERSAVDGSWDEMEECK